MKQLSFLVTVLVVSATMGVPSRGQERPADVGANKEPAERVTHFAFVSTGNPMRRVLAPVYWAVNERAQELLAEYGYPDEAVYCLCDEGRAKGPRVDGKASTANFKKTFEHLARIMGPEDHLTIFIVGHGALRGEEVIHPLSDRMCTGTELKAILDPLPSKNINIIINTCHSGGFISKLKAPGRVICTATTDKETNGAKWPEHLIVALFPPGSKPKTTFPYSPKIDFTGIKIDENDDGRISIKEAYNAALLSGVKLYKDNLREHPLLEDNGDGVGHFGKEPVIEGDGKLAAQRFLGNNGKRLNFSPAAVEHLRKLNAELKLE